MSKSYFFLLLFIFIGMTIYYIHMAKKAENTINEYKILLNKNNDTNINKLPVNKLLEYRDRNILYEPIVAPEKRVDITQYPLPVNKLLEYRDRNILYDPIVAPERRVDITQYPLPILQKINIPTRGYPDNYQLIGLLSRIEDEKILQLFGRPTFPGSNQYEYYVTTETNGFTNKIPIETKGKREIEDGTYVKVPIFDQNKGEFQVKLYNYDTPRYNPFVL
jgi:hypothetical protein